PHFEKMLYDNAELVSLLTLVWQETRDPLYARRVEETIGWLEREMVVPGGGFAGSLDADSEHEEGKFYVWSAAEIDAALGADAALFKRIYDVSAEGNWEGHNILNRLGHPAPLDDSSEAALARSRDKLLAARAGRVRPGLDDKVLADWNGLMIAALAEAGLVFDRAEWVALAARAFAFIRAEMTGGDGRLRHSWRNGQARHPASVDDYGGRAEAITTAFAGELGKNFFPLATLINNAELAIKPLQIVLVGKPDDARLKALRRAVYDVSLPNRVVLTLAPDTALPAGHP